LFYRLAVVHVALPPLRDRLDDLPSLVASFYAARGTDPGPIDGDNLDRLRRHPWPGNIRELRNVLERAWAMSPPGAVFRTLRLWVDTGAGTATTASSFGDVIDTSLPFKDAKERWNDHFERRYVAAVWNARSNNVSRAAEHAGLSRRHFRELLYKHGLLARPTDGGEDE
jgi:DNA-binding NtrC family response regulator